MLPALLSLCSILLLCGWSLPLCQRWLASEPPALRLPISFGLSVGGATLLFAALGFSGLSAALVWLVLLLLAAGGVLLGAWPQLAVAAHFTQWMRRLRAAQPAALAQLILLLAGAAALAHTSYYPFIGDDEISRYGYLARVIFRSGYIGPAERGYPLLLPLAYALPFFASGQLVEQVAKLIPLAFGVMTVSATGGLARHWFGARAGWYAAVLLAVTPPFMAWATVGYVDIPAALYILLAAYAGDRWHKTASPGWALLAGVLAGLALWAKQAGFVAFSGLAFSGLLLLTRVPRKALAGGALLLLAAFICGGWWYFLVRLLFGIHRIVSCDASAAPTSATAAFCRKLRGLWLPGCCRVPGGLCLGRDAAAPACSALVPAMVRAVHTAMVVAVLLRCAPAADGAAVFCNAGGCGIGCCAQPFFFARQFVLANGGRTAFVDCVCAAGASGRCAAMAAQPCCHLRSAPRARQGRHVPGGAVH